MAEAPDNHRTQLQCLLLAWFLAITTSLHCYDLASDPCVDKMWSLLLPLGVAMIMQAISVLVFVASAICTGELYPKAFVCWQVAYGVSCVAYADFHWPSMAGLGIGAIWSISVACSIWAALSYQFKAETARKVAEAAHPTSGAVDARLTNPEDRSEQIYRAQDDFWPSLSEERTSLRTWIAINSMLFSFSAGTLGLVWVYVTEQLSTALPSFGFAFLAVLIGALVLLHVASHEPARDLAGRFRLCYVVWTIIYLIFAIINLWRGDWVHFGWPCALHWGACLYTGIAELLEQIADRDLKNEQHDDDDDDDYDDDGHADEDWSDVSDS